MLRRNFVKAGIAASSFPYIARTALGAAPANDRITVAVVGVRGRGNGLLSGFREMPDVEVKTICDIDESVLAQRTEETEKATGKRPQAIKDFRKSLDDPEVDAIVLGTPDHWHALPTIMACQAGKDVYVEKPDSHNILEGRTMVAAMKKYERIVQLGTQARSSPAHFSAMRYIGGGKIGKVRFAKAWESADQGNIGHPPDCDPPPGVDYDLWLGPAPKRPFNPMRFHGNWRWFFDYGCGDLGNDGVHRLDYALWGLNTALAAEGKEPVTLPYSVSAHGGKLYHDDDQEWPDTQMVTYDFKDYLVTYELRLWTPYPYYGLTEGALVYGDQGYIVLSTDFWKAYDEKGDLVAEDAQEFTSKPHIRNFLDCMRSREKPAADLETIGHPASLLCHLGNAAWRAGRTLRLDPETYTFIGDDEANRYLTRPEYRKPWLLPEIKDL
jgi:predicted dehydrogenase